MAGKRRLCDESVKRDVLESALREASESGIRVSASELSEKLSSALEAAEACGTPLTEVELSAVLSTYLSNRFTAP